MAELAPFRGIHYNPKLIPSLNPVLSPPYDVISPEDRVKLFESSPYNFARLDLPYEDDPSYTGAKKRLKDWLSKEIFIQDSTPYYYLYQQTFKAEGKTYRRQTLFASVLLHDFADAVIRPHENTHGKYKADRLEILRATETNLSPIFLMTKDAEGWLASLFEESMFHPPLLVGELDGVEQRIWRIEHTAFPKVHDFFKSRPLYIVDGHHRYESALAYAREKDALGKVDKPAAYTLAAIANVYDSALVVWPTHRWIPSADYTRISRAAIEKNFRLKKSSWGELRELSRTPQEKPTFGLYAWGDCYLVEPTGSTLPGAKAKSLSKLAVAWSDNVLLGEVLGIAEQERSKYIRYEKTTAGLEEKVQKTDLLVVHAPPKVEDVTLVSDENGFMPQKSTFFIPKLASGLILRSAN